MNELPYGQGWSKTSKEFDECLRSIPQMGYGLVMISHSQDKTFTDEMVVNITRLFLLLAIVRV